jgi:hypothetical protein
MVWLSACVKGSTCRSLVNWIIWGFTEIYLAVHYRATWTCRTSASHVSIVQLVEFQWLLVEVFHLVPMSMLKYWWTQGIFSAFHVFIIHWYNDKKIFQICCSFCQIWISRECNAHLTTRFNNSPNTIPDHHNLPWYLFTIKDFNPQMISSTSFFIQTNASI